jgi:hypothetical protein
VTNDPQQLALTILVLHALRGAGSIVWNDQLVGILGRGLENNKVEWDLGLCIAALRLGKPDALAPLRRLMKNNHDPQFQQAADVLCAYLEGDMARYIAMKSSLRDLPGGGRPEYWEYVDLGDRTAADAQRTIQGILDSGGAGREMKDWSW